MTFDEFAQQIPEQAEKLHEFITDSLPDIAGVEAVQHFQDNFEKEGFTDNGTSPWPEVERRKPESPWYGFQYGSKGPSSTRAADKILKDSGELQDSIDYEKKQGEAVIYSDKPYAAVHNEGQEAKIFGKKSFTMPKRQFIGHSEELDGKVIDIIKEEIEKIIGTD